jgi:hypothetical protein
LIERGFVEIHSQLPPKGTSEVFVSYAWGDDSSEDARKRTEIVERLCELVEQDGWNILRDSTVLRSGDMTQASGNALGLPLM